MKQFTQHNVLHTCRLTTNHRHSPAHHTCTSHFSQVLPSLLLGETVFLNDLPPEDVQARLAAQSLDLSYAKFLGQRALPLDEAATYSAEGRIATNPEDYLQSSYQASQFHGQDGLGRAMFGYSDWNQGRLEARNANGEVRGSYQYVDAFGENVIVSIIIKYSAHIK